MVVQGLHNFLHGSDNKLVLSLAVVVDDEIEGAPLLLDLLHLGFNLPLTSGSC